METNETIYRFSPRADLVQRDGAWFLRMVKDIPLSASNHKEATEAARPIVAELVGEVVQRVEVQG